MRYTKWDEQQHRYVIKDDVPLMDAIQRLAAMENMENHGKPYYDRLCHLLQSETIRLFDEWDPRTQDYKRDIRRLDTYGVAIQVPRHDKLRKGTPILQGEKPKATKATNLQGNLYTLELLTSFGEESTHGHMPKGLAMIYTRDRIYYARLQPLKGKFKVKEEKP